MIQNLWITDLLKTQHLFPGSATSEVAGKHVDYTDHSLMQPGN